MPQSIEPGRLLALHELVVPPPKRPLDPAVVKNLVQSIAYGGIIAPLVVYWKNRNLHLAAGFHRHAALVELKETHIHYVLVLEADAEYWHHAENFCRLELSPKEKAFAAKFMIDHAKRQLATPAEVKAAAGKKGASATHMPKNVATATVAVAKIAPPTPAQHLAQITGMGERSARQYTQIAQNVPDLSKLPDKSTVRDLVKAASQNRAEALIAQDLGFVADALEHQPKVSKKRYARPGVHIRKAVMGLDDVLNLIEEAQEEISGERGYDKEDLLSSVYRLSQLVDDLRTVMTSFMEVLNHVR